MLALALFFGSKLIYQFHLEAIATLDRRKHNPPRDLGHDLRRSTLVCLGREEKRGVIHIQFV